MFEKTFKHELTHLSGSQPNLVMKLLVSPEKTFDTIYLQVMSGKTLSLSLLCRCVCSVSHSSRVLSGSLEEEKIIMILLK